MAALARKKVTIQYRKLEDIENKLLGTTLQAAVSAALQAKGPNGIIGDDPELRLCTEDPDYGTTVLNFFHDAGTHLFGEIVRFEPGADLPLLSKKNVGKSYNLTQAKAPDGHEAVRGVLYFSLIDDHAILLEREVNASRSERYFSWLLSELTSTVPKGTHVLLAAELQVQDGGAQLSEIGEVVVRPQPIRSSEAPMEAGDNDIIGIQKRGVAMNNTFKVLVAAGMDEASINALIEDKTDVEVVLQIKFKEERRRRTLDSNQAKLLLRNLPEDELTLNGPGGRQQGKIVKLAYPANIQMMGSLLDTEDVARALVEAFHHFKNNGYIDA